MIISPSTTSVSTPHCALGSTPIPTRGSSTRGTMALCTTSGSAPRRTNSQTKQAGQCKPGRPATSCERPHTDHTHTHTHTRTHRPHTHTHTHTRPHTHTPTTHTHTTPHTHAPTTHTHTHTHRPHTHARPHHTHTHTTHTHAHTTPHTHTHTHTHRTTHTHTPQRTTPTHMCLRRQHWWSQLCMFARARPDNGNGLAPTPLQMVPTALHKRGAV